MGPLQRGLAHARETAGEHRPAKGQAISLSIDNPYIGQQLQRNFNNIRVRSFILTGAPCLQPLKWFVLAAKMCWLPHGYRSAEVSACGVCEAAPELGVPLPSCYLSGRPPGVCGQAPRGKTVVDRLRPSNEDIVKAFRQATEDRQPVEAQDAALDTDEPAIAGPVPLPKRRPPPRP